MSKEIKDDQQQSNNDAADNYLKANIEDAKKDPDKAFDLYREYVGKAETREERIRRINLFRSGGH